MTYWNALMRAQMILVACFFLFPIAAGAAEPFAEIETLINGGQYEQALQKLDALLQQNPDNAEAQAQKGMVLGALADQAENMIEMARYGLAAMEAFETALKLDPDNITARLGRGTFSLMAPPPFGNVDAALAALLLLEANPLEDIRNTAKIAGVIVGGRFLPEESLQAMLAELEEQIAAIDGD